MKSPEILDWVALVFFLLNAGTKATGEEDSMNVTGTLEGSVSFQLRTSRVFTKIIWLKSVTSKEPSTVAILTPSEQCEPDIWISALKGRLNFSKDCKRLEIRNLIRDDSGRYTAQIQLQQGEGEPLKELFQLQVYKHLSGADLTIQCDKTENETRRLRCSVGAEEEDVRMSWTNSSKAKSLGNSVVLELSGKYPEQNLTCMARNPVSNASRTVSLKEACEAEHSSTRASTESTPTHVNKGNIGTSVGIAAGVILGLVLVAFITWFCWKKRKAGRWKHPDSAETEEQSKTIYAEVENVPTVVEIQEPHRRGGKPIKMEKEKIQTIYTTVDHYKPSPLQTDDEKMRKGQRPSREQTAKNTYAEISAQESEDWGIKSIYDTVKNPQLPQGTEYSVNI